MCAEKTCLLAKVGASLRLELLVTLVKRNLKIRYKGSVLGFFWSLLTPALTILMYAVFAHILKFNKGQPHYLQFLVSGIIVWGFTAGSLNDSLYSIAGNANLVKKVYFPRAILPLSTAFAYFLTARSSPTAVLASKTSSRPKDLMKKPSASSADTSTA